MKSIKDKVVNILEIKNSKFITILLKIDNNTNIKAIIEDLKIKYPKATHYCYGYITEKYKKSSDDKEPSNTAGLPILNVLEKENMMNIVAVVIRYFGGIKLGAAGLIRAYSKSVKEALKQAQTIELIPGYKIFLTFSYNKQKDIDYLLKEYTIIKKEYLENIKYTILLPQDKIDIINNLDYKIEKDLLIEK